MDLTGAAPQFAALHPILGRQSIFDVEAQRAGMGNDALNKEDKTIAPAPTPMVASPTATGSGVA